MEHVNPSTLASTLEYGYSQAVTSRGGKIVHVAGQVAWDHDHNLVGKGDLAAQLKQAMENVGRALEAAGATFDDVVRVRLYVVDYKPSDIGAIADATTAVFSAETPPASLLIGVQSLYAEDYLVEIEVTAVVE